MSQQNLDHLHDNQGYLSALLNILEDGVITTDEKGVIEQINPTAANLFGYEAGEIVGMPISKLMVEPHRSFHDEYIKKYLATGEYSSIEKGKEVEGICKDGAEFPFWLRLEAVQLKERLIFVGVIHDISEIRQTESNLEAAETRLSAIIDAAVDGIIIIDRLGRMEEVNPAAARIFGYDAQYLVGKNVRVLMPEPDHSQHDQYLRNYHNSGIGKIIGIGREVKGKRKDGSLFPFNLSISEVKLPKRTIYVGVIHDISAQKEAQRRVEELNAQLEQKVEERTEKLAEVVNKLLVTNRNLETQIQETQKAREALITSERELKVALAKEQELNQLKTRFVSTASHEFRTPLSTIKSSASLIARYTAPGTEAKRQKHVDRIKSAVNNLTNILDDFLSISKLEEGKFRHELADFNVVAFIDDVIDELQLMLKTGQTIRQSHEGDDEVCIDRVFLKNIVINLVSNAIKYSHEKQNIDIFTKVEDDELIIEVKDYGIGIPINEQVHLFERFFRATNAINIKGTGLGLHIVKKYVDLMDGSIKFTSAEGKGTTFTVTVPCMA